MDREEMNKVLSRCPLRITMNDGSVYEVDTPEMALCSDITLTVLHRSDDGVMRNVYLPLVTMANVEEISPAT